MREHLAEGDQGVVIEVAIGLAHESIQPDDADDFPVRVELGQTVDDPGDPAPIEPADVCNPLASRATDPTLIGERGYVPFERNDGGADVIGHLAQVAAVRLGWSDQNINTRRLHQLSHQAPAALTFTQGEAVNRKLLVVEGVW